ncbi:hypothetical protein DET48_12342 [Vibrio diazotrophicus]|uniref:Uncharacterized protein n=1 Tax=Vibrio diazotrophicus TaxID=685 RepID=A0A329E5T6_VIBDI|nr:hypothetical protein [Vibrio diazotrophicus]RAS60073.1 hypothetical protein DET48_12342 [Vibrio diazotrophicus]
MKTMTSKEISNRIDEITQLQEQHQKRDFDAELLKVMNAGGDIDSLEQKQLDDERVARRLRVEKQALEAQLPEVIYTEAKSELEALKDSCKNDHELIQEQVDIIEKAFNEAVKPALEVLEEIRIKRSNALRRAEVLTRTHQINWNNYVYFDELGSRKLKLIQIYVSRGRAPDAGSTVLTSGRFIEDLQQNEGN